MAGPKVVQRFYDLRRRQLLAREVAPNAAHRALAELERRWPGPVQIVTQNIDDLHERPDATNLIHNARGAVEGALHQLPCDLRVAWRSGRRA
jgi:NAD-dependent deacetylase